MDIFLPYFPLCQELINYFNPMQRLATFSNSQIPKNTLWEAAGSLRIL